MRRLVERRSETSKVPQLVPRFVTHWDPLEGSRLDAVAGGMNFTSLASTCQGVHINIDCNIFFKLGRKLSLTCNTLISQIPKQFCLAFADKGIMTRGE
jgi:hypothetical protein